MVRLLFILFFLLQTDLEAVWTSVANLSNNITNTTLFQFAEARDGSAVAMWVEPGATNLVKASYRNTTGTWSQTAETVQSTASAISQLDVAISRAGNVVAIWREGTGTSANLISAYRLTSNNTWVTTAALNNPVDEETVANPKVSINRNNLAFATWQSNETGGPNFLIRTSSINLALAGPTWSAPVSVTTSATSVIFPDVTTFQTGNPTLAIVAWGDTNQIQASTTSDGTTFSAPTTISSGTVQVALGTLQLYAAESGFAYGTWSNVSGSLYTVQANIFDSANWLTPQTVSGNSLAPMQPVLAGAETGDALITWELQQNGTTFLKQASRLPSGSTAFETPLLLDSFTQSTGKVVGYITENGEAIAFWRDTTSQLLSSFYPIDDAFSSPLTVAQNVSGSFGGGLTLNSEGVAAYRLATGVIVASIGTDLTVPPPEPVTGLTGQKNVSERFLGQAINSNLLQWTASISGNVVRYRVSRNGVVVASVAAVAGQESYSYFDPKVNTKTEYTYEVVAIADDGGVSQPVSIRL